MRLFFIIKHYMFIFTDKIKKNIIHYKSKILWLLTIFILLTILYLLLPNALFNTPKSTIVEDENGNLLAAQIASDGQWRFPISDSVPQKIEKCLIAFEDQYFYKHIGINPLAIVRATIQNIKAKKIISGGSTITSQVIRMYRKNRRRTIFQKIIEFTLALSLEMQCSKTGILKLYCENAPFGGNVVGIDAAAWRYYGRSAHKLSWAEAATLAVLPNAPALISPSKNRNLLLNKRNRLLDRLLQNKTIDTLTCKLSKEEPLPNKPQAIPQITPHLLTRIINDNRKGQRIKSTINRDIQIATNRMVEKHYNILKHNKIMNAAVLVVDVKTAKVLAYVGNTMPKDTTAEKYVDIITAKRSTGSTLKPFLYALMQKEGYLLPNSLVADVPTHISGYAPKNFNKKFSGAVPASKALAHSLNIPAVRMLQKYGLEKFIEKLKELKLSTITKTADYYGLSIILGGAETTLWELTGVYTSMAKVLNNFAQQNGMYNTNDYDKISYLQNTEKKENIKLVDDDIFGAAAIWITLESLTQMDRPIEGNRWKQFSSARKVAWKTGTSFGFRDAWAVGVTPNYVVGVWVGNADGEGRPKLTGTRVAAPLMFDVFKQLPTTSWFQAPYDDLMPVVVCAKSGYKATNICEEIDTVFCTKNAERTEQCPYHKLVHLDENEMFRVNSNCYPVNKIINKSWFVLPPIMEWYYKKNHAFYQTLPPYLPQCQTDETQNMAIVYPKHNARIFMPKSFSGKQQKTVAQVAHSLPNATIYWHLNKQYLGKTNDVHKMNIPVITGVNTLTLVDDNGETKKIKFEIITRKK